VKGFFNMFSDMMKQLGVLLIPHLEQFISTTMYMLLFSVYSKHALGVHNHQEMKSTAIERLSRVFKTYPEYNYDTWLSSFFEVRLSSQ